MRNKIKKVLQQYGELNANLASEHLIEQLTDDIILALGEDSRDIRYQSLGDEAVQVNVLMTYYIMGNDGGLWGEMVKMIMLICLQDVDKFVWQDGQNIVAIHIKK